MQTVLPSAQIKIFYSVRDYRIADKRNHSGNLPFFFEEGKKVFKSLPHIAFIWLQSFVLVSCSFGAVITEFSNSLESKSGEKDDEYRFVGKNQHKQLQENHGDLYGNQKHYVKFRLEGLFFS